jgi:hypothetical protein
MAYGRVTMPKFMIVTALGDKTHRNGHDHENGYSGPT